MNATYYRVGLDVGSTTAKIVVLDENGNIAYSNYERHHAHVKELVSQYFNSIQQKLGDIKCTICVTGSVGMSTAEQLHAEFVQEVVAATVFAKARYPQAKALIDIGGEDAKVVFFNGKNMELRMNGNCAGGTGAFIDQMSVLMGISNHEMSQRAMSATRVYPMAARCGVFAKTDVQNLMSRNLPEENIAASIFHSIAVQTVTTLSHGCTFTAPILLCGGPLTFMPALRKAFADYLQMDGEKDFITSTFSNLIPAMGCALRSKGEGIRLPQLQERLQRKEIQTWKSALQPLFLSEDDHAQWLAEKQKYATPILGLKAGKEKVIIGIDSGSTTTKIIATRPNGDILFTYYAPNLGNPITAVKKGLYELKEQTVKANCEIEIVGSCSTGYGEELIKAAFNLDAGIIETMAHYRAASHLMPDVSFILDIGGQDMKAIFVEHGAVVRMELNEACSSGCGTFIQTFARNLEYGIADFAKIACTAPAPCDLGTRCTVFMNSKVKQVMREGATVADISAGLAYSVIKNCLYKVLKLRGNDTLGQHIVVQGGTMKNDSVVRAFELLTQTKVARSNIPEMMGAYGCALSAAHHQATARSLDDLLAGATYETRMLQCKGCENQCLVSRYKFKDHNFYSGNKCEKVFNNKGENHVHGENIYDIKYKLLFDRPTTEKEGSIHRRIGIPRVLNMYEDYPFWFTLFEKCGIRVVLSGESSYSSYEKSAHCVMSDNICFPAKLAHSHIADLEQKGVDRIFMPFVVFERKGKGEQNSYNCPIVSGYSEVISSAQTPRVPLDSPVISFKDRGLLLGQLETYLSRFGVSHAEVRSALKAAEEAYADYQRRIVAVDRRILEQARRDGRLIVMLAGRPYHTDPLIQHRVGEMAAGLGVSVITDDIVRDQDIPLTDTLYLSQWAYPNRILRAAKWAGAQSHDVQLMQLTSFGCGPDAFLTGEVRATLARFHKNLTLLKIDDVNNVGSIKLRVRSLIESLRISHDEKQRREEQFVTTPPFTDEDRKRTLLVPFFTPFLSPLIPPAMTIAGYKVENLPLSDEVSDEQGLKYSNNEVCYPATLIVGDIIKALKSGRYDPHKVAIAMTQTGGQCRASNYIALIKRAMISNGFLDTPVVSFTTASNMQNSQPGFRIPWRKLLPVALSTLIFSDVLAKLYYATVVREKEKGLADHLKNEYLTRAKTFISINQPDGLLYLVRDAAFDFAAACTDKQTEKVGIVGEIFLKFNPYAQKHVTEWLISRGLEVVPPLITEFFTQSFVNRRTKKEDKLQRDHMPQWILRWFYHKVSGRIAQFNKAASAFPYYTPMGDIMAKARKASGIINLGAQFGEGWLISGEMATFAEEGINHVVSLQPFGCIANHIVEKGIEKKIKTLYPQMNILSLDFDSSVSNVNITNRLLLFIDNIGKQK